MVFNLIKKNDLKCLDLSQRTENNSILLRFLKVIKFLKIKNVFNNFTSVLCARMYNKTFLIGLNFLRYMYKSKKKYIKKDVF
jgi:hypothetical protein